jgi:uncharacterized membrane protein YqiK
MGFGWDTIDVIPANNLLDTPHPSTRAALCRAYRRVSIVRDSRTEEIMWSVDRLASRSLASAAVGPLFYFVGGSVGTFLFVLLLFLLIGTLIVLGVRFIPNDRVGIIEKLWSLKGSVNEGRIMAFNGQAGYEAQLLRGGIHFGKWMWQYRIHKVPLVMIPQGKVGYVYARDGEPLTPGQTLGRVVECANFQDAESFLRPRGVNPDHEIVVGQRGRQRAILREGVYAINLALFLVITEDRVYHLNVDGKHELQKLVGWQEELRAINGFNPVVIGEQMSAIDPLNPDKMLSVDSIGIVTIHDGPSLAPGEIIAPSVGNDPAEEHYHNNYQDAESFIQAGGRRGRQYVPLTDGTYFINRWFATVELIPKTVVPIGHVGVVVSYYGPMGKDLSGDSFRHGERVARGERGVWERPMGPGKYPFNTYAGLMVLVPTTNFVLHWVTGRTEAHRYDDTLKSIEMVTRDAYEPTLPLSVVVHIDYMKAPSVIQRFGDVKKLITQTLDPMLSAFFRDVAHKRTMLELLQQRDAIQTEARKELQRRFAEFDIECVDVLIGKPDTQEAGGKIETLLEQLRQRQLSVEQIETYQKQRAAAEEQKKLNEAQAVAARQTELTGSKVQIDIARNQADADLERARKHAEQTIVTAEAESKQRILAGQGEAKRIAEIGQAEAEVLSRKIASFADPRLYALSIVAEHLSHSTQPLVPQQVFMSGGGGGSGNGKSAASLGMVSTLVDLMIAEKSGFRMPTARNGNAPVVVAHTEEMTRNS